MKELADTSRQAIWLGSLNPRPAKDSSLTRATDSQLSMVMNSLDRNLQDLRSLQFERPVALQMQLSD